jgi:hypothetical protein
MSYKKLMFAPLLLAILINTAYAGVLKEGATHFKAIGKLAAFQWAPSNYRDADHPNEFTYDIAYYIPSSLKEATKSRAMIFNHGGGSTTMDRPGSLHAVSLYAPDLVKMAEELKMVVVLPSANGLNWGGHTISLMRQLGALMRSELDIDSDRLAMSGHSMGGMGITRNYLWLADEFAFFLPLAAGMDLNPFLQNPTALESQINKVFNVPYIHWQGLRDDFQIFVDRCKLQQSETQKLEQKYGSPSKLQIIFADTGHNYIYNEFRNLASKAFETPRNLYQKELWGSLLTRDRMAVENNITFHVDGSPRYFWVEAIDSDTSKDERIDFHAKVEGNDIKIDIINGALGAPTQTRKLRVYLSSKFVDLGRNVNVYINGIKAATRTPDHQTLAPKSVDPTDSGFLFEDAIDAPIPRSASVK